MNKKLHFLGNKCVLLLLVAFTSQTTFSQINLGPADAGITIAPSNFLGDLGGNYGKGTRFIKDNNLAMTRLMIGAHLSVNPADWLSVRLAINHGTIAGDDAVIEPKGGFEEARKIRNQNFKSKITEAFIAAEFYPTVFMEYDPADLLHKLRPYGLIGVGAFHFNPQGHDPVTGSWIYLRELHTEGQGFAEYPDRKEYKLTQLNVPLGAGIKFYVSDNISVSLEIIHRVTFSDYLDDLSTTYIDNALFYKYLPLSTAIVADRMNDKSVNTTARNAGSQRGTSAHKDAYYSAGFKLGFRLGASNDGNRNSTRCPTIRL